MTREEFNEALLEDDLDMKQVCNIAGDLYKEIDELKSFNIAAKEFADSLVDENVRLNLRINMLQTIILNKTNALLAN